MKSFYLFILFIFYGLLTFGQSSSLHGKITSEQTGEELIYANIFVTTNGSFVPGGSTNFEGNYSIPLDPGIYSININYTGHSDTLIENIVIHPNQNTKLDLILSEKLRPNDEIVFAEKVQIKEGESIINFGTIRLRKIKENLQLKISQPLLH